MQTKPTQELFSGKSYKLCFVAIGIVLHGESDAMLIYLQDTLIADRYPVRILTQVTDYIFSFSKGRLAVNHPTGSISIFNSRFVCIQQVKLFELVFYCTHHPALETGTEFLNTK